MKNKHLARLLLIVSAWLLLSCADRSVPPMQEKSPPEQVTTPQVLDLSLQQELPDDSENGEDFAKKKLLPNLFEQQRKEKKLSLSGKPVLAADHPDYTESVQGAELSVEVKIP